MLSQLERGIKTQIDDNEYHRSSRLDQGLSHLSQGEWTARGDQRAGAASLRRNARGRRGEFSDRGRRICRLSWAKRRRENNGAENVVRAVESNLGRRAGARFRPLGAAQRNEAAI